MLTGRAIESFQKLLWPSLFGTFGNLLMIWVTFKLVSIYGYLGIPYARASVYWFYFLPFGFFNLYILARIMRLLPCVETLCVAVFSSVLSMLLYFYVAPIFGLSELFPSLIVLGSITIFFSFSYLILISLLAKKTLRNILVL